MRVNKFLNLCLMKNRYKEPVFWKYYLSEKGLKAIVGVKDSEIIYFNV